MQSNRYLSLFVHAIYLVLTGLQLVFVPNMLLGMFGFDPTAEIWIKVLGIVVLSLSILYFTVNKHGSPEVVRATVLMRFFVGSGFVLLVLFGQTKTNLILFAGIDIATAVWTWFELKNKKS